MQKEKPAFEVIPNWRGYSLNLLERVQIAVIEVNHTGRQVSYGQAALIAATTTAVTPASIAPTAVAAAATRVAAVGAAAIPAGAAIGKSDPACKAPVTVAATAAIVSRTAASACPAEAPVPSPRHQDKTARRHRTDRDQKARYPGYHGTLPILCASHKGHADVTIGRKA
jgi:hypothetical protein